MTRETERMEKALRGCAEAGVPGTVDLWSGIREKVAAPERTPRRSRLVPHTRAGWALVALLALFFGMGAYGASGWAYDLFQGELPGADAKVLGTKVDQEQTIDGATVDVEWAYADEEFVVIGFSVEDHKEGERSTAGHRTELQPLFFNEVDGNSAALPPHRGDLTDEDGGEFDLISGTTMVDDGGWWPWPLANTAVFATPEGLEPGDSHRFDFDMFLGGPLGFLPTEKPRGAAGPDEMPVGPFDFSFEVPVRPAPTIDLDQKVESNGVTATLDQVVNSPARPQAVVCFRPLEEGYEWMPFVKTEPASREPITPQPLGDGCWSAPLYDLKEESRSSITVTEVMGISAEDAPDSPRGMRTVPGPWTFDFEMPRQ